MHDLRGDVNFSVRWGSSICPSLLGCGARGGEYGQVGRRVRDQAVSGAGTERRNALEFPALRSVTNLFKKQLEFPIFDPGRRNIVCGWGACAGAYDPQGQEIVASFCAAKVMAHHWELLSGVLKKRSVRVTRRGGWGTIWCFSHSRNRIWRR